VRLYRRSFNFSLIGFFFLGIRDYFEQEMYPEEETEDDENKMFFQPLLSGSSSGGDISASADDAA
jgi:hypothetical protein